MAPDGFAQFVGNVRAAIGAIGDPALGGDDLSDAESAYRLKMKKHVVLRHSLRAGTRLAASDVALKRRPDPPEDVAFRIDQVVNRTLVVDLAPDRPISMEQPD